MKQSKNEKIAKLTRQGLAFLLAMVLMTSAFVPGLTARATETPTETIEVLTESSTEIKEALAVSSEQVTEPGTTLVEETTVPTEETDDVVICTECQQDACLCGQECTCAPDADKHDEDCPLYVEPTPYQKAMQELDAREAEAKILLDGLDQNAEDYLNQMIEICNAFYDRLFADLNVVADLWDADAISDDEYFAAEEKVMEILQYLLDTYGYEYGMSAPLITGDYAKYFVSASSSGTIRTNEVRAYNMPGVHVNEEIPEEYVDVILGYKEASSLNIHVPSGVKANNEKGKQYENEGLDRCKNAIVHATTGNHDAICGKTYVEYLNVGEKDDGTKVHVRVTIVDYEPLANQTEVYIGLQTTAVYPDEWADGGKEWQKRPGVSVNNINWVQLKYEFFDDKGNSVTVKGNTSYYDVDWNQAVQLHDSYTGIYVTGTCLLDYFDQSFNDLTPRIGAGCVLFDDYNDKSRPGNKRQGTNANAVATETDSGFTETFNCSSMTRTFSFRRGNSETGSSVTARGAIFHSAEPVVRTGKLIISKTVNGITKDNGEKFTFNIELGSAINGTYGEIAFTNGKATVQLADGESITASGLPAGISYKVTEVDAEGYIVSSEGASGKIPIASLGEYAEAHFINTTSTAVKVKKIVTGNLGDWSKAFDFHIEYTELQDGAATHVYTAEEPKVISLRNGEEALIDNVLTGTQFKISEVNLLAGDYTVYVNDQKVEIVDGAATFMIDKISGEGFEIVFTNDKDVTIETGVVLDSMPYVLMLGAVAVCAFFFLRKRRVEE